MGGGGGLKSGLVKAKSVILPRLYVKGNISVFSCKIITGYVCYVGDVGHISQIDM
jgi:hypothetical protein